jgi:hypothetical protein
MAAAPLLTTSALSAPDSSASARSAKAPPRDQVDLQRDVAARGVRQGANGGGAEGGAAQVGVEQDAGRVHDATRPGA